MIITDFLAGHVDGAPESILCYCTCRILTLVHAPRPWPAPSCTSLVAFIILCHLVSTHFLYGIAGNRYFLMLACFFDLT